MADDTDVIARLFAQEIPEIAAGTVEIRAVARKPGYRSKLAVASRDASVDCIGACVGIRGHPDAATESIVVDPVECLILIGSSIDEPDGQLTEDDWELADLTGGSP